MSKNRQSTLRIGSWKSATTGNPLPNENIDNIYSFVPEMETARYNNCGDYIFDLRLREGKDIQKFIENNPEMAKKRIDKLRFMVLGTIKHLKSIICSTYFIGRSAATTVPGHDWAPLHANRPWLGARMDQAIFLAEKTDDAEVLIDICRRVPGWRQESVLIVDKVDKALKYIRTLIEEQGPVRANYLDGIVVYDNHGRGLHSIHRINSVFHRPSAGANLEYWEGFIHRDLEALPSILAPIVL